jgi:hypothetical protein
MPERKKSVFVTVRVNPTIENLIDAYRREQETIPSRADAIEKLIELGFAAWTRKKDEKSR